MFSFFLFLSYLSRSLFKPGSAMSEKVCIFGMNDVLKQLDTLLGPGRGDRELALAAVMSNPSALQILGCIKPRFDPYSLRGAPAFLADTS